MRGAPHPRYFPGWSGPHFLCKGSQSLFFLCFRSPFGFPSRVSFRFRFPLAFWFPPSGFPSGFPLLPLSSLCSSFGRWFPVGFRLPHQVSRRLPLPGSLPLLLASRFASLEVIPNVKHRSRPCQGTFAPVSGGPSPRFPPHRKQEQDDLAGTMRHLAPHPPHHTSPGSRCQGLTQQEADLGRLVSLLTHVCAEHAPPLEMPPAAIWNGPGLPTAPWLRYSAPGSPSLRRRTCLRDDKWSV